MVTAPTYPVAFLFDIDNTLLDNDRVTTDLRRHLELHVGSERQKHYWEIFEQLPLSLDTRTILARCSVTELPIRATSVCSKFPTS